MSNQSEIWEGFENQESFFDNICSDLHHQPEESAIDRQLISRGFDSFYKNHRLNECLKGSFYIYQGFLTQMSEELPCQLTFLQNLSYARFQTSISEYKVAFYKKDAFFELIFSDQETFNSFIMEIREICLSSDFYQRYTIVKLVKEGKNSKTCVVQATFDDDARFTAKVFNKMNFIGSQNPKQKEALVNEVGALRVLKGCKFLQFCEVHETGGNIYIVTEYSGKDTLEVVLKRLASFHRLSRKIAQKIMFKILETLAIFASHGIIHRNLKPSNILIEDDEFNIKINNFGLVTCRDSAFSNSKICGTPGYIAPEMINLGKQEGQSYNEKCDVFAAGCIFFEILFGFPLFNKFNLGSISFNKITMEEIQEFVFDTAFEQPNRASDDCLNLLLSLLQYDPNRRISAQEALNHPYFNNLNQQSRNENSQMHFQKNPIPRNFTEAFGQYRNAHCEENADVSDDEPDISAKWSNLNHSIFLKHPSKTRKQ